MPRLSTTSVRVTALFPDDLGTGPWRSCRRWCRVLDQVDHAAELGGGNRGVSFQYLCRICSRHQQVVDNPVGGPSCHRGPWPLPRNSRQWPSPKPGVERHRGTLQAHVGHQPRLLVVGQFPADAPSGSRQRASSNSSWQQVGIGGNSGSHARVFLRAHRAGLALARIEQPRPPGRSCRHPLMMAIWRLASVIDGLGRQSGSS